MKLTVQMERLKRLNKLIEQKSTGNPNRLADRLGISRSRLYVILNELKLMGAPIRYSRLLSSFYYTHPIECHFNCILRKINFKKLPDVDGSVR